MNRWKISALALLLLYSLQGSAQAHKEYLLEKHWKFSKGDFADAMQPAFDDSRWQSVTVPHDWAVDGPFDGHNDLQKVKIVQNGEQEASLKAGRTGGLPFIGTGWYRNTFPTPAGQHQRTILLFDGAMSHAIVYVNGKQAGQWPYGYNSFYFDITSLLHVSGNNTLAVRLENEEQSSRWYPGAGLYRNVHLIVTSQAHIPIWSAVITTPAITGKQATVALRVPVAGAAAGTPLRLQTLIKNAAGQTVATTTTQLKAQDTTMFAQTLSIDAPTLWSPETPALYTATATLYAGEQVQDSYTSTFGIRTLQFVPGKGFLLNGQVRKLKGVCNHHDLGPLGTAINTAALRRQLALLKDMGCDAVRTSHNMPAPELVSLCDEMGLMLMVESFDEWKTPKVKNGYSKLFEAWAEKDIINMVRHYRNHPSVILWSIGNEVPDQSRPGGKDLARWLQDICHREDPTRLVTAGMDRFDDALKTGFAAVLDVPGFNYKPHRYREANATLPQGFLIGTETASTVSSRGIYKFPVAAFKNKQYDDNQCSSYDLEACPWSQVPDDEFVRQDSLDYVGGEFVWTGFDYLGEPTPYDSRWPSHSSYFGIIDLAGLPKDRYYLYRSRWNTQQATLHLLPHWTWPGREGQVTPVFCYTSYATAELFVNGKSMGRQSKNTSDNQSRYRLMWKDVVYQPGSIKVVAYDAQGKAVATEEIKTAGQPDHIVLTTDKKKLAADGKDLAFVTATIVDKAGNPCPDAASTLRFAVTGAGRFRAVANGDATSLEAFQQPQMKAFSGQLVIAVEAGDTAGDIQLKVSGDNLKTALYTLKAFL